ncbi:phage tail assembly protein [Fodinicurvata sp. EGI_FJ10296]|uniref:phage tail assembly protein n=1 Tax=Fodinicurvata sp. EGI_FJ10296 TaxID=3231908 RepID=UPI00345122EF
MAQRAATTLTLNHPVTRTDDTVLRELEFRRPTGRDLRQMGKLKGSQIDQSLWLIAKLTGIGPDETDLLDGEDINRASEIVDGFLSH